MNGIKVTYDISTREHAQETLNLVMAELCQPYTPEYADELVDILDEIATRYAGLGLTAHLTTQEREQVMKHPWLAALLNAWPIPLGLGYIYLGNWKRFLAVLGLQILLPLLLAYLGLRSLSSYLLAALWLYSIIDAHNQTKHHEP